MSTDNRKLKIDVYGCGFATVEYSHNEDSPAMGPILEKLVNGISQCRSKNVDLHITVHEEGVKEKHPVIKTKNPIVLSKDQLLKIYGQTNEWDIARKILAEILRTIKSSPDVVRLYIHFVRSSGSFSLS